jgi:ribosomal-protein-alanine N-acetyltransferase
MQERYHLTTLAQDEGYLFDVTEVERHDPQLIPVLAELDLLTWSEPTFSRFTLGAFLRHGRIFIATADNQVIGVCHTLRDFEDPSEVVLFNMTLRPGWRGHGLGTRFLTAILEKLRGKGVRSVSLQVADSNHRAIRVYKEKLGFQFVSAHPDEYRTGQTYLLMRLVLGVL